jgi:hypothetical protein
MTLIKISHTIGHAYGGIYYFLFFLFIFFLNFKNNFIWKQINIKTKWNDIKNKWKQNQNYLWPIAAIRIFSEKYI